jgi:hypothetical protein
MHFTTSSIIVCLATPSSSGIEWNIIISEEHLFYLILKFYRCLVTVREKIFEEKRDKKLFFQNKRFFIVLVKEEVSSLVYLVFLPKLLSFLSSYGIKDVSKHTVIDNFIL